MHLPYLQGEYGGLPNGKMPFFLNPPYFADHVLPQGDAALQIISFPLIAATPQDTFYDHKRGGDALLSDVEMGTFARGMMGSIQDVPTRGHCERVSGFAEGTARAMGLTGQEVRDVRYGALLHDVGKAFIPREILGKDSGLTPGEWEVMKQHPEYGFRLLSNYQWCAPDILTAALMHHERPDGNGYPSGLRGDEIPLGVRIISAADAFDAMTSERSYSLPLHRHEALGRLEGGMGTQFDWDVVDALRGVINDRMAPVHQTLMC